MKIINRWKFGKLILAVMSLSLILTGCAPAAQDLMSGITPSSPQTVPGTLEPDFLESLNTFSWKLMQASADQEGNVMLSPVSVYLALAMTLNGADAQTKTAILEALSAQDMDPEALNQAAGQLMQALIEGKEGYKLNISNSLWLREGFEADPDFLQKNADYFSAAMQSLDFNSDKAPETINRWVSKATEGTIDTIVDKIDPAVVMYLINAIYFKADWQTPFSANNTFPRPFETPDGSKDTDFMHRLMAMEVISSMDGKGILLPYQDPGVAFMAFLPNENISPAEWIQKVDAAAFEGLLANRASKTIDLALPKFETRYEDNLMNELDKLGMGVAFDPGAADFSLMQKSRAKDLFISAVQHKTFIRTDELGTEAAAVTSVEVSVTSMPSFDEQIIFDRPFAYAIVDLETGVPLFVGIMTDPTAD